MSTSTENKISARGLGARLKVALLAASAVTLMGSAAHAYNGDPGYLDYDGGMARVGPDGGDFLNSAHSFLSFGPGSPVGLSFNGVSQMDVRALHSNFSEIPPDTMGAIGATQFMETTNGAYAVYNKSTGVQTKLIADGSFWAAAGQPAMDGAQHFSNGDSRVIFDKTSQKWIVTSFAASLDSIAIAVSDTADATGAWKSTVFSGFKDGFGTGVADYPTLAIDSKAIYIGTNNFTQTSGNPACFGGGFCGTTLNVISRSDLLGAGGPSVLSLKQFNTTAADYIGGIDNGFAIQGVNQVGPDSGRILAVGAANYGPVTYSITNPGTAGATQTTATLVDTTPYSSNQGAVQPDGTRNIDPLDDRFSGQVWEFKGKIYAVHTITLPGAAHTSLELYVIDAATNAVIQKSIIGDGTHDFFQGALAINNHGQVVLSYNESGLDMNVSILAQSFHQVSGGNGMIAADGLPTVLKVSPIGDYHNGSTQFSGAVGRQRWGDYAQVTVDPNDPTKFWVIGEYALGYLPSPTASFSRWGTWITEYGVAAVPEPATWMMMIVGFGFAGVAVRRRRALNA
jgi:hypothetical protein